MNEHERWELKEEISTGHLCCLAVKLLRKQNWVVDKNADQALIEGDEDVPAILSGIDLSSDDWLSVR